jgi:hypothetical protein
MTQASHLPPEMRLLMQSAGEVAQRWRQRAEELRTIASNIGHPNAAQDLFVLADRWEAMAERAEQRAAGKV